MFSHLLVSSSSSSSSDYTGSMHSYLLGFGQRSIVDLKWRLDYHVRSSTTGVEHVPVYFVSLKTVVSKLFLEDRAYMIMHGQFV